MSLLGIGASLIGGLLGSKGSSGETKSNVIDPRLARFVYGEDGKSGIVRDIADLYRMQMGQGGLNDLQRGGMEMLRQQYMSPQYTQGFDAMRSMGLGLMGGGVAGNPFTSGGMGGGMGGNGGMAGSTPQGPAVVRPTTNLQYQPFQYQQTGALGAMNTPIPSVQEYQQSRQTQAPSQQTIDQMIEDYMKRMGLGRYGQSTSDGAGTGEMGDYGGFDGGLLGMLGMDGGGQSVGNNGGEGLGSAMGGADVSMGSAAGNGGDNGAELGFAKGGKVTKNRLGGPNPKGPDDGYAALDEGEFVLRKKAAQKIGYDKLHKMNKRG